MDKCKINRSDFLNALYQQIINYYSFKHSFSILLMILSVGILVVFNNYLEYNFIKVFLLLFISIPVMFYTVITINFKQQGVPLIIFDKSWHFIKNTKEEIILCSYPQNRNYYLHIPKPNSKYNSRLVLGVGSNKIINLSNHIYAGILMKSIPKEKVNLFIYMAFICSIYKETLTGTSQ